MPEIWKPITHIKGLRKKHLISSSGRVKNATTGKVLKQRAHHKNGYAMVDLKHKGISKTVDVHRLTGIYHLPKPSKGRTQINHNKGDKMDCRARNLSWVSPSENSKHSRATGLYGRYSVKKHVRKRKNGATVIRQHQRNKKLSN